ncbi:hypothetical protein RP20_CCG004726 [Aedes albopictus]|nr:hypothetical protein RP20_CCG004726 [Aedes albopictus]
MLRPKDPTKPKQSVSSIHPSVYDTRLCCVSSSCTNTLSTRVPQPHVPPNQEDPALGPTMLTPVSNRQERYKRSKRGRRLDDTYRTGSELIATNVGDLLTKPGHLVGVSKSKRSRPPPRVRDDRALFVDGLALLASRA